MDTIERGHLEAWGAPLSFPLQNARSSDCANRKWGFLATWGWLDLAFRSDFDLSFLRTIERGSFVRHKRSLLRYRFHFDNLCGGGLGSKYILDFGRQRFERNLLLDLVQCSIRCYLDVPSVVIKKIISTS